MIRHYGVFAMIVAVALAGTFLPLPLLTGCDREPIPAGKALQPPPPEAAGAHPGPDDPVTADELPILQHIPAPTYPREAKTKGIEGTVRVRLLVGADGKVNEAFVESPVDPALDRAALESARQATFQPAKKEGKPVPVWVMVPMRFTLK